MDLDLDEVVAGKKKTKIFFACSDEIKIVSGCFFSGRGMMRPNNFGGPMRGGRGGMSRGEHNSEENKSNFS